MYEIKANAYLLELDPRRSTPMPTAIDLEGQGQDAARLPQTTIVRVQDKGGLCHHLLAAAHHSQARQSGTLALRHEPQLFQSLGGMRKRIEVQCNDAEGQRCWKMLENVGKC